MGSSYCRIKMKTEGKPTMNFKYTRIYAGPDGNTHFQDVEVPMTSKQGDQFKSLSVNNAFRVLTA